MTTRTKKAPASMVEMVPKAELEAFKQKVIETALWAKDSQGWCDSGFNEGLERMGLPPIRAFYVDINYTVNDPRTVYVHNYSEQPEGPVTADQVAAELGRGAQEVADFKITGARFTVEVKQQQTYPASIKLLGTTEEEARATLSNELVARQVGYDVENLLSWEIKPESEQGTARFRGQNGNEVTRTPRDGITDPCRGDVNCTICYVEPSRRGYERLTGRYVRV